MRFYSVGNRKNSVVHDIVYHITIKKKYVYIERETNKMIWQHIAKVPKSAVKEPENISYMQAHLLYLDW